MLLACAAAAESKRRGPTVFDQPFGQRGMIPYKIVSSDDHMIETAGLWEERVPKRFGERAPRLVKDPPGKKGLFFSCGDSSMGLSMAFCAGKTVDKNFLEAG